MDNRVAAFVFTLPASALVAGLVMKAFRGNPESPGMSKLDTARVARVFDASFLVAHWGEEGLGRKVERHKHSHD